MQEPSNPMASSLSSPPWKPHLDSLLANLKAHAASLFQPRGTTQSRPPPAPWARISSPAVGGSHRFDLAMSTEAVEERLAGVPVYALSNSAEEFVLVSGVRTGKCLGLFCFNREDAESLLDQMKVANRDMREGSRVVAVALNKVFQLKVDGVAFRLVPDPSQIANAIKVQERIGDTVEDFPGVPLFQVLLRLGARLYRLTSAYAANLRWLPTPPPTEKRCGERPPRGRLDGLGGCHVEHWLQPMLILKTSRSLVLKSENKRYRPMFFKKEDLEDSLLKASREQNQLNPAFRRGDIQVRSLEEIINAMKGSSASKWDDVVFIPPGFNVSMGLSEEKATAMG
ncbi:protein TIC 22-like, chloroplastic [Iris pallida]|uniref:Protein TIC 22-like, chloroplastic n=1 Tax=Iris pallida TaxID=29817 RepID=A0AAX6EVA6_IRIPA|nr:protein TIC 22-like, chloroplastic [Iris pallida]